MHRTSRRDAPREERGESAPFEPAARLVQETIARLGPPPNPHRIVLVSNGVRFWVHEYSELCASLRETGDAEAIECAAALEAIRLCPGSFRVILQAHDGRWHAARAVTMTAQGGSA